jgi:hypothetical protein
MIALHLAGLSRPKLRAGTVGAALLIAVTVGAESRDWVHAATKLPAPSPSSPASAGGRATFGIKPSHETLTAPIDARSRFAYTATPGAVQPDYVAVSNNAKTPVRLSVYASDGFNTATDGFDLLPASKKPVDVGAWITLKTNVVDLAPGASVVIPFIVRVPAKVPPGDHVGGIVASLRTYGVDKKGDRVAIDQRVGARVYLRVQGSLDPGLAISNLKAKYHGSWWNPFASVRVTVSYTVSNPGNVRLGAHQSLVVSGWYGSAHPQSVPDIPELLPDNSQAQKFVVRGVVPAFHQKAVVTVAPFSLPGDTDGRLTTLVMAVHLWVIPWALLFCIALVLVLLAITWRSIRRRRRPADVAPPVGGQDRKSVGAQP